MDIVPASSKKRPTPSHGSPDAPAKRRNGPLPSTARFPPLTPKTRQQLLEREMNILFEAEYQEDVIRYMYEMDMQTRAMVETIDLQPELQWYMRPYLIDFLVEIHQQYRLKPETLYLAVNVIDRYVSKRVVFKKHYQLVGCAALWIAAKYEDAKERVPSVSELGTMCCGAYEESSFLQMEGHVLSTIGWQLGHPTAEAWLRLYSIGAHRPDDSELEAASTGHIARFLMELSLFHRSYVGLKSSDIAAGALLLSRSILGKPRRISEERPGIMTVVSLLDAHLGDHMASISSVVTKKYSHPYYSRASTAVKEWYAQGRRFCGSNVLSTVPIVIRRPSSQSTSVTSLPTSMSSTSICTVSSRSPQLTPGSLSSLSLNSSPTSSISSYPSIECHSDSSPSERSVTDESRERSLMCSPRLTTSKQTISTDAWPVTETEKMSMHCATSVCMSRDL